MKHIYITILLFTTVFCQAQIVNIPDANFKNALIGDGYDENDDGEIQVSEATSVQIMYVAGEDITDLTGIEAFINLRRLSCQNNQITSLDLSNNLSLEDVIVFGNQLTSLNLGNNTIVSSLICSSNQLTSLDLSNNTNLVTVTATYNQLTSLNLTNLSLLENLRVSYNQFSNLDLSPNVNLGVLECDSNQLTNLNLSSNPNIYALFIRNNQLQMLNVTNNPQLTRIICPNNQLTEIDLSNNVNITSIDLSSNQFMSIDISSLVNLEYLTLDDNLNLEYLNFKSGNNDDFDVADRASLENLPNLEFVCVDDINSNFTSNFQYLIDQTIVFTEYCSFTPGGEFYEITGNTMLDANNNGCDVNDNAYANLQLDITNGTENGVFYSNEAGSYTVPIQAGNYTITPQFENLTYFTATPASITVDFPTDASPAIQDFCITPNGIHNDVEITIVPTEVARPGFEAYYKLIYRNKGNTTLSGNITITFNDDVMNLVTASPTVDTQTTGNLTWNYANLEPFETNEILFTMLLNTPTDATFPVNGDDILPFVATINPVNGDEIPDDNVFELNQIVVNSFDPNDIRCLEGNEIAEAQVGKYVHYLIRFENTGTASAVNIVVKDVIDTNKFDISSVTPLNGSHNYVTRIVNGNEIEFIFENIQLPFDDATNDGYVLFKIRTVPTLVVGDTFSNQAEIYFDFNAPIITNTSTTTIENNLSVNEFDNNKIIAAYPNPVENELFFGTNQHIEKITVYNLSGKVVQQYKAASSSLNKIDVKSLSKVLYFVKIQTANGTQTQKIIKQ
ncbi:DUF7619 domain-containing protein [Kordia sp.]|uniref:DUF7619 domain-containing protein n=1 Tax=Kordia sp. TaxID=1965332 RepID=UPI003D27B2F7